MNTSKVDGKDVVYTTDTVFTVEVGKGTKAAYKVSKEFVGDIHNAVLCFRSTPRDGEYKKRLVMQRDGIKQVLVRAKANSN
jgi:hypothetical protein